MMKLYSKALYAFIIPFSFFSLSHAQLLKEKAVLTYADTLRGSNGPGRDWWDALKYDIHVKFNLDDSTISGKNVMSFKPTGSINMMQIDLQAPLVIDSITGYSSINMYDSMGNLLGKKSGMGNIMYTKEGNAYFAFPGIKEGTEKDIQQITVYYHGKPTIARRPPWDGGLIWKKDKNNNPFISIACQGLGASVWYPCKDIQSDEPDSAEMHITIPDSLTCIGNGRFRGKITNGDGTATYDWAVESPINNYTIIPYIGKYAHFSEVYKGEAGPLDMDYWVLEYNLEKAKEHFKDAPLMMQAFEHWFGPYPFYKDGFKLVEAPHLGMEHQSAVAYGNQYKKGYLGSDLSRTGWGLKWDYIIVHESGHEWFANNISTKDIADMWVHEGFTTYTEVLFTEYHYGKQAGSEYIIGQRKGIQNKSTIIGPYGVNKEGSSDMYPKGANLIHTIRQVINNDSLFRQILRGMNATFRHKTVTTKEVEDYISKESRINFSKVFDQYLRNIDIPVLEYQVKENMIMYRYSNCIDGFNLPVKVSFAKDSNKTSWLKPTTRWQPIKMAGGDAIDSIIVDPNFYINTKKVD